MRLAVPALSIILSLALTPQAQAEVSFVHGVNNSGHHISHQTFSRKRRAVVHLYDRAPPGRGGCAWRADGRGGRVKVCHLRRIGRR